MDPLPPTRECADIDLRTQLRNNLSSVPAPLQWIAGHQTIKATKQQNVHIKRNHEVDKLAKLAAGLPDTPPADMSEIHVGGGPAPTPTKKWLLNGRLYSGYSGTHWLSWLPLEGTRRMY